jgi:DNA-binding NarL/FixJ family response regulator
MPVRIVIVDDDAPIRRLLRRILEERPGWEVCGEAANGNDAVAQIEQLAPDLAIIDLAMPDKQERYRGRAGDLRYLTPDCHAPVDRPRGIRRVGESRPRSWISGSSYQVKRQ